MHVSMRVILNGEVRRAGEAGKASREKRGGSSRCLLRQIMVMPLMTVLVIR